MTGNDRSEIAEIRRDLREMRFYLDDRDLREAVNAWIDESHDKSDADTAREFVERELNQMLVEYEMYNAPDLGRGEAGFPSECEDCRHYGAACPVLLDEAETRWRSRKLEQAETEQDARRVYEEQAVDVSCKRIPRILETWDNRYADFVREGQQLLSRVEEDLRDEDPVEGVDEDGAALPAMADGGGDP